MLVLTISSSPQHRAPTLSGRQARPSSEAAHGVNIAHRVQAWQLKGCASVMSGCLQCSA